MAPSAIAALQAALPSGVCITHADAIAPHLVDWRGQISGHADILLKPRDTATVQQIVRLARQHAIALVPQGGNTGLVGGGIPSASRDRPVALLSLQAMTRIRSIDPDGLSMVTEAGAILEAVHMAAESRDCVFPLSLASKGSATIGGLVSTNAGGVQVLRHGSMRALVLGLEAVLPDGNRLDQLSPLRKDNSGYDIKQLLIGAEGTLGVVTAVALKLAPRPATLTTAWAGVASADAALALLGRLRLALGEVIESFELLEQAALDLVGEFIPGVQMPLAGSHTFHVLVEAAAPQHRLEAVLATALEAGEVQDVVVANSLAQREALWKLRESVPEAERLEGPAIKNDIAVPVEGVPAFLRAALAMFAAEFPGSRPIAFGHLGDGNLHLNLRPPAGADAHIWLAAEQPRARLATDDLVVAHHGSISAEHGIGTLKARELARLGDPGKLAAMRAIKAALDPDNIMNPGKLFG
ncbi:MAG: FAD-binding oxidoreductase [Sphingomonadaceae bacterium]